MEITNNRAITLADFQRRPAASSSRTRAAKVSTSTGEEFMEHLLEPGGQPPFDLDERVNLRVSRNVATCDWGGGRLGQPCLAGDGVCPSE